MSAFRELMLLKTIFPYSGDWSLNDKNIAKKQTKKQNTNNNNNSNK